MNDKKMISDILKEGITPKEDNRILQSLRTGLNTILTEASEESETTKSNKHEKKKSKWYVDVQNSLDKTKTPLAPSQVSVMKAMGIKDDDTGVNRSLFGKKLHRDKNDEGVPYEFTLEELGKIRAILGSA